ncbi:hypothetical protein ANAEL_00699 [Anaerolineales bacterium]|nr:hypothetical protein ANAEL_00699 [Anaerolineales bacterium]
MKKLYLLIGCLALTSACQSASATPQAEATPIATSTPPPTATVTQTFTSVPTLPPTTVPLFFIDEFNSDLGAWVSFQTGGEETPSVKLENDLLRIDLPSPNTWYYAIHNAHEYSSIFVSAEFSGTPAGSFGVICNYNESKGWYEFNIASDGTYSILFGQWLVEGIAQYTPIAIESTEYLKAGKLDYEIGLTCQNNILLPHINGKLFRKVDVTRYGLTEGKVGINASSFEEVPMIATFDWFKVEEPVE